MQQAMDKAKEKANEDPQLAQGKATDVNYADKMTTKVASKNVHINFATGSATIDQSSYALLNEIYSSAIAAEGLKVGVYGHTDNTGDPSKNITLSQARAESVKSYLIEKGLAANRIESQGFGDAQPIASNGTAAGKAQNRRVEIALGN